MADDTTKLPIQTIDDQQEDAADVTDTDLESIANGVLTPDDDAVEDDEITFSELEDDDEDSEDENNDVDNLHSNIDEGTE